MSDIEQIGQLVKTRTLDLQRSSSGLVARGLDDLARLEIEPQLKELAAMLKNPSSWEQRIEAWQQLRDLPPATAGWRESLRDLVYSGDGWTRIFAAEILAWHGRGEVDAIPVLVATLDATLDLRQFEWARLACGALGKYSGPAQPLSTLALPVLLRALGAGDHNVRGYAALALGSLGAISRSALVKIGNLLDRSQSPMAECYLEALQKIDPAIVTPMDAWVTALDHDDPAIRAEAVSSIGGKVNGTSAAVPELLRMAQDHSAEVRKVVAISLARIEVANQSVITRLEHLTDDSDVSVRLAAAYALAKHARRHKTHLKQLREGLRHHQPSVRLLAAWALGNLGRSGHWLSLAALKNALKSEVDDQVQAAIENAIQELKHPERG